MISNRIFSVGPDELCELDHIQLEAPDFIVYWYESGSYDGDGDAIVVKDGIMYEIGLGHCSCYGPADEFVIDRYGQEPGLDLNPKHGTPVADIDWSDATTLDYPNRESLVATVLELLETERGV